MKISPDFKLREVCGLWIVTPEGVGNIDYSELISLNESATLLWRELSEKEFTINDAVDVVMDNYDDIDRETALHDVEEMLAVWKEKKLLIE